MLVSFPRARSLRKMSRMKVILELERGFNGLMGKTIDYLENPKAASIPEMKRELRRHLAEVAALRLALDSYPQGELGF
jgi:hypothetical protein